MGDHQNQATANIEDISNRVNGLNISGKKMRRRPRKSLDEALRSFDETAVAFTEQANTVVKLLDTDGELNRADVESICLVRTRGLQLVRLAQLLSDSAIPALVRQVICLDAETSFAVHDLLEYFKKQIENITRRVIGISGSEGILRKIAEECYHQATSPTGELNPDDYLATSKWAESKDRRENWIKFWTRSLCNCPGGPTLFQPMEDSVTKPPTQTPRYLFRAWDNNSTGINGEDVIASILSKDDNENRHKIDMFSMDYQEASEMLHNHLDKGLVNSRLTDNLVSWSSSLIFVFQYANYRFCQWWNKQQEDVYICAVDTTKLPRGQFARDKWLLNWFSNATLLEEENSFRNFRLNRTDYDNGEYLSQGKLHIDGRSCTFSLRELKDSGLWDLYPEFNIHDVNRDPEVRTTWTNYVKKLRWSWQFTKKTTKAEVQCALGIAQKCFPGFDHDDMALLILSFRERKLQPEKPSFQNPFVDYIDYKEPAEVHRYSTLRKRLSELSKASGGHGMKLFEQLYDLEDTEED
ncbi:uncharacterized protein FFUJ_06489 [Fusarium fujikuroi IMI 58289]|uniref:DUF7587 domain-containing protein n=1 Tax=Gibberella fujikuroi (strain CBS 195.34 / IMI 58289 / NRRL A-6831) TaxID=1279085 RepID=S0E780_GIBF5|nr:uncharacterized protein FFUJ_06489 [Fusarium fujikuroi IMI 58289]KLO88621.1 uncharacterized protein LW93_4430 [Fusarium fujikuroi]CCT70510.1 uncharacterized protein FFUJ_06489 [Fusarium fujikuroi IMI 58289]SCN83739.1 uncharacterized protein FFM5_03108 [Fusarium fujikuroi]SCO48187.1 uncharacterized protein FFMR_09081 [Fusarium fujikuroi]